MKEYTERKNDLIAHIKGREYSIEKIINLYASSIIDQCDDEDEIKRLVEPYLTIDELSGDSYAANSTIEWVEILVKKLDKNDV